MRRTLSVQSDVFLCYQAIPFAGTVHRPLYAQTACSSYFLCEEGIKAVIGTDAKRLHVFYANQRSDNHLVDEEEKVVDH
jgi:hypothetical protein